MKRVVVTGLGTITSLGYNVEEVWSNTRNSYCSIEPITLFDTEDSSVKVAAEVKNYNSKDFFTSFNSKKYNRFTQFALIASAEAYKDAGITDNSVNSNRVAVVYGSGIGGDTIGKEYETCMTKGSKYVSPLLLPGNLVNMAAANIAMEYKANGTCMSLVAACATGTDCIGTAFRHIQFGMADIVIAGATEACINPLVVAGFASLKAVSRTEDKTRASIPFDKERSGFVMGEGAATLILEEYEHALKRNAKIYAEIAGFGTTCDAYKIVSPNPDMTQAKRAMEDAVKDAGITVGDISYINAHGTSTGLNDKYESIMIEDMYYKNGNTVPVSSTKSMMGHALGAAGAIEAVLSIKALEDSFIPETVGYKTYDEDCRLDFVTGHGRTKELHYVQSNSFGFGGHNSVLVFRNSKLL
ncbi:beta-ketoacyl-ACP synthase II [Anaeromicropila populeti]|uniref:3-oxoacyl-[acyl-carrier-protein] synthase 2 n=1 Tax=Anaeromicropila populeti TaxID=37658 RepID=A0A1I6LFV4_9FIRM|nr:beta-ketoacyl-ACP synthase II [Anaeromicropila populeti]SFS02369.1 3-oxoacyl-[acyl-carrier-protein] synthase II [Anaeromicropila populeti]